MTAVIVEDEFIVAEHLKNILETNGVEVLSIAHNYTEALKSIALKADIYFLDINLNSKKDGILLAEQLVLIQLPFVFVTANNDLNTLKKAITTKPLGYITKPFKNRDIIAIIELVRLSLTPKSELKIALHNQTINVNQKDILYCQANGSYTDIYLANSKYTQRIVLKELFERLDSNFKRVHRSYVVNTLKITSQNKNAVFINNIKIPISKTYQIDF